MAAKRRAIEIVSFKKTLYLLIFLCPCLSARPLLPTESPTFDSPDIASLIAPKTALGLDAAPAPANPPSAIEAPGSVDASLIARPRRLLADFAMKLRNIAYRHGGREPTTGFDCSGFVHYVFSGSLGLDLPTDSASQFQTGTRVERDALKMGDLVFFRVKGRRVSHVGIYLDNGLFIHSPSTGKRVRIDRLNESYWAKRYVGAKRPEALAGNAPKANLRAVAG